MEEKEMREAKEKVHKKGKKRIDCERKEIQEEKSEGK